jgi:hypothetical protein
MRIDENSNMTRLNTSKPIREYWQCLIGLNFRIVVLLGDPKLEINYAILMGG